MQNPKDAPAKAAVKNTTGKSPLCKATKSIVTVAIVDTPAAKPSKPSIKLTVLVIPTIQK